MEFEFRKSSYSTGGNAGTCVEVALNVPGLRAIRDSKNPDQTPLVFGHQRFRTFIEQVKASAFGN